MEENYSYELYWYIVTWLEKDYKKNLSCVEIELDT